ncbi:hypothetical protein N7478_001282 [Penicillium angulare]|uniref:uncharacterized protein n=1 Tax=Penicillium angulare TaxID=116970 RepID=UPI0025422F51|nr:uncharacterized protein N7478_001282 [Penicillium angulare]KAJ5292031.1 hypothetical protein N7478_001282 [Penicillium angulare]
MSSTPPINLGTWKLAIGILVSVTFIIIIEKIFGIHVNIKYSQGPMATFPGWAHVLGPGETQTTLLHRWIEVHRNQAQDNTIKSRQLAVDV